MQEGEASFALKFICYKRKIAQVGDFSYYETLNQITKP